MVKYSRIVYESSDSSNMTCLGFIYLIFLFINSTITVSSTLVLRGKFIAVVVVRWCGSVLTKKEEDWTKRKEALRIDTHDNHNKTNISETQHLHSHGLLCDHITYFHWSFCRFSSHF